MPKQQNACQSNRTYTNGAFRSFFCCEKPHSMTHWADNYATVGRIRTMSTQVTESRYKSSVKTKARKTNNQASFGGSLLQNNMEVEAAIELARHLDETGSHRVRTGFTPGVTEPKKLCSGSVGLHHLNRLFSVCTKLTSSSSWFV